MLFPSSSSQKLLPARHLFTSDMSAYSSPEERILSVPVIQILVALCYRFVSTTGKVMEKRKLRGLSSLLLLAVTYLVIWIDLFVPIGANASFPGPWFGISIAKNLIRIVLLLLVGHFFSFETIPSFDSLFPKDSAIVRSRLFPDAMEMLYGLVIGGSAFGIVVVCSYIMSLLHYTNPVLQTMSHNALTPAVFLGSVGLSLSVGYSEELFFRCFAEESFGNLSFPPYLAMACSAILFGLSHGAQQLGGMVVATLLGFVFSLFKRNSKSLHAIALGHAFYDLCILLLTFNL